MVRNSFLKGAHTEKVDQISPVDVRRNCTGISPSLEEWKRIFPSPVIADLT